MKNTSTFVALIAIALVALYATFANANRPPVIKPSARPLYVTLQAAPGNKIVQMFDRIGTSADVIKQFPDGQICHKISGPTATNIEGVSMKFHLLSCDLTTGYVNSKWVRS